MLSNSPNFTIDNIVSLWKIDGPIQLEIDNSKRKKKFNAQVIRRNGVFLVFASGKVVATGFKEVTKAGSTLQELYPDNSVIFNKVVNITAHTFNIRELIDSYDDTAYEPEIYPAVYIKHTQAREAEVLVKEYDKLVEINREIRQDLNALILTVLILIVESKDISDSLRKNLRNSI